MWKFLTFGRPEVEQKKSRRKKIFEVTFFWPDNAGTLKLPQTGQMVLLSTNLIRAETTHCDCIFENLGKNCGKNFFSEKILGNLSLPHCFSIRLAPKLPCTLPTNRWTILWSMSESLRALWDKLLGHNWEKKLEKVVFSWKNRVFRHDQRSFRQNVRTKKCLEYRVVHVCKVSAHC